MAKKKEKPVVDNETGSLKVKEKQETQPTGNETKGNVAKVKEKMKKKPQIVEETITKVDLNKPPKTEEDADQKQETTNVATDQPTETLQEVVEEVSPEQSPVQDEKTPVLEEITVEGEDQEVVVEATAGIVAEAIKENLETGDPLPENVQKLMNFMEETGGDLNDYVKLNQDYSKLDNQDLLYEYYKNTKPHLNAEEINFLMEDQFSFDEDVDEDRDIRRKKLALKEQVANAKTH